MTSDILQATLKHKKQLTGDVFHLEFETERPFPFKAGQFLSIHFPSDKANAWRAYSIACRPHPGDRHLELCVKKMPGGPASTFLCELEPGARVEIKGPSGKFLANQTGVSRYYFITTGTGIAPLKAMIEDLLFNQHVSTPIFLLFGFRSEADQFYLDWMNTLAKQSPSFSFEIALSQPSPAWTGHQGRVTRYLETQWTHEADQHYYLCGLGEMVKDVRQLLETRGVPTDHIHYERFT